MELSERVAESLEFTAWWRHAATTYALPPGYRQGGQRWSRPAERKLSNRNALARPEQCDTQVHFRISQWKRARDPSETRRTRASIAAVDPIDAARKPSSVIRECQLRTQSPEIGGSPLDEVAGRGTGDAQGTRIEIPLGTEADTDLAAADTDHSPSIVLGGSPSETNSAYRKRRDARGVRRRSVD